MRQLTEKKPNAFIDHVVQTLELRNDAALARLLGLTKSVICRARAENRISNDLIVMIHEEAPDVLTISKLKELRGYRRSSDHYPRQQAAA